jgi:hypothetical protein
MAEHSHAPSSDSELIKHLKSIIKVCNSFIFYLFRMLLYGSVNISFRGVCLNVGDPGVYHAEILYVFWIVSVSQ